MKRTLIFITIFIMLFSVGCGAKPNPQPQQPEEQPQVQAPPELKIEDTILGKKSLYENNTNLYKIDTQVLDGIIYSRMHLYQGNLLFLYDIYNEELEESNSYLRLVSFETGEVINEVKMNSIYEMRVQEINGNLVIHDYGKAWILNEKLEILDEYDFEGETAYFDPTGENVYKFTYNEGIKILNLESGEEKTLLASSVNLFPYGDADQKVSVTYIDRDTRKRVSAYVDLTDASVTTLDTPKAMTTIYYEDGIWHGMICEDPYYYLFGNEENQNIFETKNESTIFVCPETSQIIIFERDENEILKGYIYDKDGKFVSSCELNGLLGFFAEPPIWCEAFQGYMLNMMREDDKPEILFWDISEQMQGEDLHMFQMKELLEVPKGTAIGQEYYERAKEISEKYGVQILIADQCRTDFSQRTADLLMAEENISIALDELELAMSSYPDGFIDQLKYDGFTEIEIQLLGEMIQKENGMLLGGFIEYEVGKFVMGLNITTAELEAKPLHQTYHHEISHIIEQKLWSESEYIENGYSYDKWNSFNPEGFEYANFNADRYNMYWDYFEYFVDDYAATDQNEDRARILEYASAGEWYVFNGREPVKEKLAYYSECIRAGFDTTNWPEKTIWEDTPW